MGVACCGCCEKCSDYSDYNVTRQLIDRTRGRVNVIDRAVDVILTGEFLVALVLFSMGLYFLLVIGGVIVW